MTKLVTTIVTTIFVLLALAAIAPSIAVLFNSLVPVILVTAVAAALLRVIWFYTRRW